MLDRTLSAEAERAEPRRGTVLFFVAAFGITWLLQVPALLALGGVLSGPPERFMLLVGLGAFGPMLAAILASRVEGGRAQVRALFRALRPRSVGAGWYVLALLISGATFVVAMAAYRVLGGQDGGPWLYLPSDAPHIAALIFFSIGEEIGWRGFALPRLQTRYGPLAASLVIGVLWTLWHIPMFLLSGISMGLLPNLALFIVPGSIVFTWIYNRTGGGLLFAVLAHMGTHLNNSNRALPGNATPLAIHTAGYLVLAFALVILDRRSWTLTASSTSPRP